MGTMTKMYQSQAEIQKLTKTTMEEMEAEHAKRMTEVETRALAQIQRAKRDIGTTTASSPISTVDNPPPADDDDFDFKVTIEDAGSPLATSVSTSPIPAN